MGSKFASILVQQHDLHLKAALPYVLSARKCSDSVPENINLKACLRHPLWLYPLLSDFESLSFHTVFCEESLQPHFQGSLLKALPLLSTLHCCVPELGLCFLLFANPIG